MKELPFGGEASERSGVPRPANTLKEYKERDAILLAAIGGPKWDQASKRPE
ncbi:isocitrate/isopropylmalate family dehydrogenase, partial [Oenococcus oeni]|uniref:isocitrate/isopropylmalate family dehydrogenase n=1 Tax=Oenococcus oeni TaxID=1247 RepID=UPI0030B992B2